MGLHALRPRASADFDFGSGIWGSGIWGSGIWGSGNRLLDPLYLRTFCPGMVLSRVFGATFQSLYLRTFCQGIVLSRVFGRNMSDPEKRLLDPLYLRTFRPGIVLSRVFGRNISVHVLIIEFGQKLCFFRVFGRNISVTVPSDLLPKIVILSGLWAQHFGSGSREAKN